MNRPSLLSERIGRVLTTSLHGVVGMVDGLLAASREEAFRIAWQAGRCHVSLPKAEPPDHVDVPVPKSVFRAALARIAALCNERIPTSVSLYGGLGEVAVGADPVKVVRVKFVNTPEEQSLELAPAPVALPPPAGKQSLAAESDKNWPLPPDGILRLIREPDSAVREPR